MHQLEDSIRGLRNTVDREQPKSAMERNRRKIVLLENVREGPEAVGLDEIARLQRRLGDKGRRVRLVMQRLAGIRRRIPLGVIDGESSRSAPRILRPLPQ